MIQVKNIQKSYGLITILADISFSLGKGQKVALVGDNGIGKTTLLKIIAGLEEIDSGSLELSSTAYIGYLPQDTSLVKDETVEQYLRREVGIDVIKQKLESLSEHLQDKTKTEEYSIIHEQYERLGGYAFEHRMKVMKTGFGLDSIALDCSLLNLSSGQKSKVVLIGILLKGVDLLLLDEPTNNLDLPALIWLEGFLKKSEATAIIVSHDRRFLDRTVKKIFELDRNTRMLNISRGTYSDYIEMKNKRISRQKEDYFLQQEEIRRLSEQANKQRISAARGSNWRGSDNDKFLRGFKRNRAAGSGKKAKAIEKRIEQMNKIEKPVERDPLFIPLEAGLRSGSLDIRVRDVVAGYVDGFTVGPVSIDVPFRSRVGIMGLNGSGKSTLLKTITGILLPFQGEVEIGSGIRLGNMMQEHESLPRSETLLGFLVNRASLSQERSYAILARFGFSGQQVKLSIETLSPGERARLLLALFLAQSVNVLVLDEPTNYLDLEALEESLKSYQVTVLLVSHDRYFLEMAKLDTTYLLSDGMLTKISNYKVYVSDAEVRAEQLLKLI